MRHVSARLVLVFTAIATAVMPVASQTPPAQKLSFEVASVKRNRSGVFTGTTIGARGERFVGTNVTLRMLLQFAYRPDDGSPLLRDRIIGGPDWMDADHFDVRAKLEADARSFQQEQIQLMLQSLLEDRFQLKAHHETRELAVYNLTIAKGGHRMKLSEDQTPPDTSGKPVMTFDPAVPLARGATRQLATPSPGGILLTITGSAIRIATLVNLLHGYAGRMVVDKTNLTELFDIRLQFALETLSAGPAVVPPPAGQIAAPLALDPAGPSLFTAIQEQLGLKLESARGLVEVQVIDSVQKPSEN